MGKRAFGQWYYSMENSYPTKAEAQREANKIKKEGVYFVRVAPTNWGPYASHKWAVFVRRK